VPGLGVANALIGLGQIMNLVAMQTVVANQAARRERDERFGFYTMAASGGQLIGPAAAGFLAGYASTDATGANLNLTPVFVFAAILAGASLILSVALRGSYLAPASRRSEEQPNHLSAAWSVLRRPSIPQAMASSLSVVLSTDLLVAYLPAYGEANALPVELVGVLLALRAGGSMVSRLLMGRLIRWIGRGPVLAGSLLLAGLGFAALPLLPHPVVLVGLMLLLGLGLGLGQPMSIAWIANRVPRDQRGTALGVRLTASRLGQLVLPSLMGAIAGAAGLAAMFWALAAVLGSASGMVWRTEFDDAEIDEEGAPP